MTGEAKLLEVVVVVVVGTLNRASLAAVEPRKLCLS